MTCMYARQIVIFYSTSKKTFQAYRTAANEGTSPYGALLLECWAKGGYVSHNPGVLDRGHSFADPCSQKRWSPCHLMGVFVLGLVRRTDEVERELIHNGRHSFLICRQCRGCWRVQIPHSNYCAMPQMARVVTVVRGGDLTGH